MPGVSGSRVVHGLVGSAAAVVLVAVPAAAAAAPTPTGAGGGERIVSYDVALAVQADGSLQVSERIDYDFGVAARHGIVRDIANRQRYDSGRDRVYPVQDVRVSSPAAPARFETTESGGEVHVKIGDPALTVTGRQQYTIAYTVLAATSRFANHDELYWNAVGPGWSVPIEAASVTLTGPAAIRAVACYAGPVGGTGECAQETRSGPAARYRGGPLGPGEALTVVAGWPPGTAAGAAPVLADRLTPQRFLVRRPWVAGAALVVLAGPLLVLWRRWRRVAGARAELAGAVPAYGPPETSPPDGIPPGLAGVLVAGGRPQRTHAIAILTDLAGRGHLSIDPAEDGDWRLQARRPVIGLPPAERSLLAGVFADSPDVVLSGLRRQLPGVMRQVQADLGAEARAAGWLRTDRDIGVRVAAGVVGCLAVVAGVPALVALGLTVGAGAVGIALIVGGVLLVISAAVGPPRLSPAGAAMRARVLGFSQWLRTMRPAGLPPADEEAALRGLLPYAVAFGFAPVLVQAFTPVLAGAGFAAGHYWYYYQDIDRFTSDVSTASTPPSSSGGGSGFSGGSAGGGGGGGGGGSW